MLGSVMLVVGSLVLGGGVLAGLVLLGVRAKVPLAVDLLRRFSRLFNPVQRRTAGLPGAYASLIRHTGRASGRAYETPVGAVPTDDGFLIALPYGARTQWVKNVLAAGSATIVHAGETHAVDRPELVPLAAVEDRIPERDRRSLRMLRVDQCLRLHRTDLADAA